MKSWLPGVLRHKITRGRASKLLSVTPGQGGEGGYPPADPPAPAHAVTPSGAENVWTWPTDQFHWSPEATTDDLPAESHWYGR